MHVHVNHRQPARQQSRTVKTARKTKRINKPAKKVKTLKQTATGKRAVGWGFKLGADFWTLLGGIIVTIPEFLLYLYSLKKLCHGIRRYYNSTSAVSCTLPLQRSGLRRQVLRVVTPLLSSSWSGTVAVVGDGWNSGSMPSSRTPSLTSGLSSVSSSTLSSWPWSIFHWQRSLKGLWAAHIWLVFGEIPPVL